jgi:pimeloyl-ACP methyl ester carboxylesterase
MNKLETRLGPLAWQESGEGPPLVFFAGAFANRELWRDVVAALEDRYRCITIDLPLGAHEWPLRPGADRSAASLARLELDCLDLLEVDGVTVVANDTAGGLLLLALASEHPALERIDRIVLTNCDSYDQFPPDKLKRASAICRRLPRLARAGIRARFRSAKARRTAAATVVARGLDAEREQSFFGRVRDPRVAADLVAATAGFRPEILVAAAGAIPRFERPVLVIWGDADEFFPLEHAHRLAADFPDATLIIVPGAKTWVPIDDPVAVADGIGAFVPPSPHAAGKGSRDR